MNRRDVTARKVRLNSQGYDSAGSYWGVDRPLYWIAFIQPDGSEYSDIIRASSRREAVDYAITQSETTGGPP